MQWTDGPNAGFTAASAKPWLALNPNYTTINAAQRDRRPELGLQLHTPAHSPARKTLALVYGDFKDLDPNHPRVFSYTRTLNGEAYLIVHNVSSQPIEYTLPGNMKAGTTCSQTIQAMKTPRRSFT